MTESAKQHEAILKQTEEMLARCKETAKLYTLKPGDSITDVTQAVLIHPNTSDLLKSAITHKHHKVFVFEYPSDGLMIKGYISLPEKTDKPLPLILFLRGGNRLFALPHPGDLSAQEGYAVVATTNRGGVNEGEDEFGGDDVNDVKNLIEFLPTLEKWLNIHFHPSNKYMVGFSRGGMQLFLTLGRYPELQPQLKKIASVSGLLSLDRALEERLDFKTTLINDFGYTEDEKGKEWVIMRQPMHYIPKIAKNLPILIAQGTQDNRVSLDEGYDMLEALKASGHDVTYVEIEGGDHMLTNKPEFIPQLIEWLEA